MSRLVCSVAALLLLSTPAAAAQPAAPDEIARTVEAFARIGFAYGPSFSPDGRQIAFISSASGLPQVWIVPTAGGEPRQVTKLNDPVQNVYWSPKGDWLAYDVAPGGGLNVQIYVVRPDGSEARLLTAGGQENNSLTGWTDDGAALRIGTNADYPSGFDALLLDPTTRKTRVVAARNGINGVTDVSPDGRRAIVYRVKTRDDNNLYLVDLKTGAETLLTAHEGKGQQSWGEFSPDGRRVYVQSNNGRDLSAFGVIDLDTDGQPSPIRYIATRDDAEANAAVLSPDGKVAALLWNAAGRSELALIDARTGKALPAPKLPLDIAGALEFSHDGKLLALNGGGADRTNDLYVITVADGDLRRLTQSAHDGVDLARLVRPELIRYRAHDGLELSGWLYRPPGRTGPMPVVFSYHGGPEGQSRPSLNDTIQALVSRGVAVFAPNVRGSSGFGKQFMALDNGPRRVDGVADIKASTDALVAAGIADPKRLGVMGGSYGGYMVMAGVTEYPDMFAAGANLFGVVNFDTFFKNTQPWMAAISTHEYGDPATQADMLKALSPIHKLDRIKTPLIVLHGANDTNVPVIEAEQIVADLKGRDIPVEYILFPDEGHGWRKAPNKVRSTTAIVAFFETRLKP